MLDIGRLLERLDVEIGGLVAENRALHERLAASTRGDAQNDFEETPRQRDVPTRESAVTRMRARTATALNATGLSV